MKPYEKLAEFYKKDWGNECIKYIELINGIIKTFNLNINSILDIGCGTGILANELKNRNFKVTGIDISEEMIRVAIETTNDIKFLISDMRYFNLNKTFDMITCTFDAINYLVIDKDIEDTLNNVYRHLNCGGIFLFDFNPPYLYEDKHFGVINREFNNIQFKQILDYNKVSKIATTIFDFDNGHLEKHIQKAYAVEEMKNHLLKANFEIMGSYRNFKMLPINDRSYKVFYLAKKK